MAVVETSRRLLSLLLLLVVNSVIKTANAFSASCLPKTRTTKSVSSKLFSEKLFSESVYESIDDCKIAVIPNFLDRQQVTALRNDAQSLWDQNKFSTDALAGYGSKGSFDPTKDRAVLRLNQWKNQDNGDWQLRKSFGETIMQRVRHDLAVNLDRPHLDHGLATTKYGDGSTEISYTRFGPGAFLKRHVDEHHEELKGRDGWSKPTRRSISWLIYLNEEDWDGRRDGGQLRCFQRKDRLAAAKIGSRPNGDLQIGWLRASLVDPVERPVFMDSRRHDGNSCALYIVDDGGRQEFISKEFSSQPILYMAGGEALSKQLLLERRDIAERFHYIELPKSMLTEMGGGNYLGSGLAPEKDEVLEDVDPTGGTLVLFDSVTLPHEVLATRDRERWATSGWMHEDQQPICGQERPCV